MSCDGAARRQPCLLIMAPSSPDRSCDLWACHHKVRMDFSRSGEPADNAFIESLGGKFRAECLNARWFLMLEVAREKLEAWR